MFFSLQMAAEIIVHKRPLQVSGNVFKLLRYVLQV